MSEGLSIGDTVQLKSGGPLMTYERDANGLLVCVYFDADNKLQTVAFKVESLKKVSNA